MTRTLLLMVLVACGGPNANPPAAKPSLTAAAAPATCTADAQCSCRSFDGAHFQPGSEPSTCCTAETGCVDALGATISAGHCMTCVYD